MQIEIQEIDCCRLNVKCEAEAEQVSDKRAEIVQYFKKSNVPGFRPGKATLDAVKLHFKSKIEELTKTELAQTAYHTAIAEKNIRPFGQPQFLSIHLDGTKFKCDFCVNKIPEVELKQYKGFELPKGTIPDAVEMAEKILQELRVRNGETLPFGEDDFVQEGDSAIINYSGFLEGEEEAVMTSDGEMFIVGNAHVEGFNENTLGMKIGERREFVAHIPADVPNAKIADKDLRFTVELVMASKNNPAPLDDVLASKVGVKDMAELMTTTQSMASARVKELETRYLTDQISARLIENHELVIPVWLSSFEAKLLAKQNGYDWDAFNDEQKKEFITTADKNVKLSIILDKIRESEPDAQMSDEEVFNSIKLNIAKYKSTLPGMQDKTDEEVLGAINQSGFMPALASHVKDDFTMNFIIKNSNVVE